MPDNKKIKFEEALEELEKVVAALEAGDVPLEESLKLFEKGIKLAKLCMKKLTEAEKKVEILKETEKEKVEVPFKTPTDEKKDKKRDEELLF